MREPGIESSSTINSTYRAETIAADEVIRTHATTLDELFNITLHQKENNLPRRLYWIPKLHKTPYKARFIAGSRTCTTPKLSKLITNSLKLVKRHCNAYCKTILERKWIINNALDVLHALDEKQLSLKKVSNLGFFHVVHKSATCQTQTSAAWSTGKSFYHQRKKLHCHQ